MLTTHPQFFEILFYHFLMMPGRKKYLKKYMQNINLFETKYNLLLTKYNFKLLLSYYSFKNLGIILVSCLNPKLGMPVSWKDV